MLTRIENIDAPALLDRLRERTCAVLGYGSQGSAFARNLRDSGLPVIVAQRPGGPRHSEARADGFVPCSVREASQAADLLILALPDDHAPDVYRDEIAPHLRRGQTLALLHGFTVHYGLIAPPPEVDVVLVAPKAQGRGVRDAFVAGRGVFALIAVHEDSSGQARQAALALAAAIGSHRAGVFETTFREETETDLFGEQAVLCGGLSALVLAGFETLVEAGYPPELAYFECCHELKLLVDLIHEHGIRGMRERISSTARFGDVTRGPRVIDEHVRGRMRDLLDEIRSGRFAREFIAEQTAGSPLVRAALNRLAQHQLEAIGEELRGTARGA